MSTGGIIVRLKGGLGNQMFQYATGMAVAKRNGVNLILDLSSYENQSDKDTHRTFELEAFALSHTDTTLRPASLIERLTRKVLGKLFPVDPYGFDRSVFSTSVLDGFYQNERYFLGIREFILKEFTLKDESAQFKETVAFIHTRPSVSLHVRRGDYVFNQFASSFHGAMGIEYFKKAYDAITSRIGMDFNLFIFTDDINWAEKNITMHPKTYILSGNGFAPAEELILMSKCTHNIISNSTFSWWGAWLNQHTDKIVIAPRQWTTDRQNPGILPSTWTKI